MIVYEIEPVTSYRVVRRENSEGPAQGVFIGGFATLGEFKSSKQAERFADLLVAEDKAAGITSGCVKGLNRQWDAPRTVVVDVSKLQGKATVYFFQGDEVIHAEAFTGNVSSGYRRSIELNGWYSRHEAVIHSGKFKYKVLAPQA
ncbi:hypothetical protein IRZ59_00245 [Pseudomonas guariconensis]|uniref:hypothetical protein n=1 Tax=Pseudomonas guariconensis TaxID=1288410 RepID=UPI0018ABF345|nr:hypothetical protein [Pseudomonas guariconensis]MBF8728866.1 hypothetical protein [Pseudomonas guariconensis]